MKKRKNFCIEVRYDGMIINRKPWAIREVWTVIKGRSEYVRKIDNLIGWGPYTALYEVQLRDRFNPTYYLVAE